jgi:hypothetical protein
MWRERRPFWEEGEGRGRTRPGERRDGGGGGGGGGGVKKEQGSCEVTRDRISRRVMKKKRVGRRVAPQHQKTVGWIGARLMQEVMAVKEREREREREREGEMRGRRERVREEGRQERWIWICVVGHDAWKRGREINREQQEQQQVQQQQQQQQQEQEQESKR